jgi:hypothetical protein
VKKYEGEGLVPIITIEPGIAQANFQVTGCTTLDFSEDENLTVGDTVIVIGSESDVAAMTGALQAHGGIKVKTVPITVEEMFKKRDEFRVLIRGLAGVVEKSDRIGLGDKEKWMRNLLASDRSEKAKIVGMRIILFMHMKGKKQRCNPAIKTIAKGVGRGTTYVKKALKELRETGWLEWESGGIKKGGTSNSYRPMSPRGLQCESRTETPTGVH